MNSPAVTIIDYGVGNTGSLMNMLKKIHIDAKISIYPEEIDSADKLILPGIGSFDYGMDRLKQLDLIDVLRTTVLQRNTPILGICLGMQLFTKSSEEGIRPGLGWFNAETVRFRPPDSSQIKIPHMGWEMLEIRKSHNLFRESAVNAMYYFVHSYHVVCHDTEDILTTSSYGYDFVSSIAKDNIIGVQFHPEKSHKYGMKILENFCKDN